MMIFLLSLLLSNVWLSIWILASGASSFSLISFRPPTCYRSSSTPSSSSSLSFSSNPISLTELVEDDDGDGDYFDLNEDTVDDWTPDRVKAQHKREASRIRAERVTTPSLQPFSPTTTTTTTTTPSSSSDQSSDDENNNDGESNNQSNSRRRPSPYTEEEEELIAKMGGNTKQTQQKRLPGYLGDCTLEEIATDYSVPICYLADILCMWGVPVPIETKALLGDLVTGEQAFAILEAVNSLDIAVLQDRYVNENLIQLCSYWEIPLPKAFEMCTKEGWSLPFGVRTCLRVEQADELIRVLASDLYDDDDEEDDAY
jgi:hypothetical protein